LRVIGATAFGPEAALLAVLDRDTKIGDSYRDGILMRKFMRN
jgi:hypothetical protein